MIIDNCRNRGYVCIDGDKSELRALLPLLPKKWNTTDMAYLGFLQVVVWKLNPITRRYFEQSRGKDRIYRIMMAFTAWNCDRVAAKMQRIIQQQKPRHH